MTDGSNPPVCHIHRAIAAGKAANPLTEPADIDELAIVKKLARSGDERVKLRAVELLLELKAKAQGRSSAAQTTRAD
ncbi:MAG TPA: hypothetical protein VH762_03230, partial [Gemmatimonadaceae bacterium]